MVPIPRDSALGHSLDILSSSNDSNVWSRLRTTGIERTPRPGAVEKILSAYFHFLIFSAMNMCLFPGIFHKP